MSVICVLLFLVFALCVLRAAEEKPELRRESKSSGEFTMVKLSSLKTTVYAHRDDGAYTEDPLGPLMDSLILEGIKVPIPFFVDDDGGNVLIGGHRRVSALRFLADKGVAGFSRDMMAPALRIINSDRKDRLCESLAENSLRAPLTRYERILAVKKLADEDVSQVRGAHVLNISDTQYSRDLLIATHEWAYRLLIEQGIDGAPLAELLYAARDADRIEELREVLQDWVARKRLDVAQIQRERKRTRQKALKPEQTHPRKWMKPHVWKSWLEALKSGGSLDTDLDWTYNANISEDKLTIPAISNLDLHKAPVNHLADIVERLVGIADLIVEYLRGRKGAKPKQPSSPRGFEFLRNAGLSDLADDLEERAKELAEAEAQSSEADGEEDPERGQIEDRPERDVTDDVETPAAPFPINQPETESAPPAAPRRGGLKGKKRPAGGDEGVSPTDEAASE